MRATDIERLQRERDLYQRLLELGHRAELRPLLEDALGLAVDATGADQGYLELYDEHGTGMPTWWIARGCSSEEVESIRDIISHGIIAEALATGETVRTPSAMSDHRFAEQSSVRNNRIQAALCVPLGKSDPIGALYLQRCHGFVPFSDNDVELVECFARHVTPFVARLLLLQRSRDELDPTRAVRAALRVDGLIGRSQALAEVLRRVMLVAPRDVTVLITGASGTGKTTLAKAIHDNSPRAGKPFVELSCAVIPDELAENELFGATRGGHSQADRPIPGKVAAADGGTLFLDEIGELSPRLQAKLLQLLQSRTYFPLGASRAVDADIRLIAATNVDLERRVVEKTFREDLFYRLHVVPIRMPDLSERTGDIPLLAEYFCTLYRDKRAPPIHISPAGLHALHLAEWPGHVRQLANVVQRGLIFALGEGAAAIEPHHLFPEHGPPSGARDAGAQSFHEATRDYQRSLLAQALADTRWNVSEAARRLGLARSTMNHFIRTYGLARERA